MNQWPPLPDYGCFEHWPADGVAFIHPDDIATVSRMLPSGRVLCRHRFDDTYYHYRYGEIRFRMRPTMWSKLKHEGIDIGDEVETTGLGLERERFVARVWGMHFVRRSGRILYRLKRADGSEVPKLHLREEFKLLTDKQRIRPGFTQYPVPRDNGTADKIAMDDVALDP